MLPAALSSGMAPAALFGWTALGFVAFFILEQVLHFHHCHDPRGDCRQPLGYLILVGDALFNFLSGLTFLVGGLVAYGAAAAMDVSFLIPFAAGNFLYIGATDLVPELHRHATSGRRVEHAAAFAAGLTLLWWLGGLGAG